VETIVSGQADVADPTVATEGAAGEGAEILDNFWTMGELASETGGERITGTNDLSNAIAHAIDNGSHFYTLSYSPRDQKMDGQFRSIEVRIPEVKYKLGYRKGYYALDFHPSFGRNQKFGGRKDGPGSESPSAAADARSAEFRRNSLWSPGCSC
jgi:hypothetical protein